MGGNFYLRKPSCFSIGKNYDYTFDKHGLFIHVCRTTNGMMIWNIDPKELNAFCEAGCQPYYEDGSLVSWESLKKSVEKCENHDYEYVGKGIRFC